MRNGDGNRGSETPPGKHGPSLKGPERQSLRERRGRKARVPGSRGQRDKSWESDKGELDCTLSHTQGIVEERIHSQEKNGSKIEEIQRDKLRGVAQWIECLPSVGEALGSIPTTT